MALFPSYARNFQPYPERGAAFHALRPLLERLERVEFNFEVTNPAVNQGQLTSHFDVALERAIVQLGAKKVDIELPHPILKRYDFAFEFEDLVVVVEIEKANQEKILRDLLKCHMCLNSGANFCIVALPTNYPHKVGTWNPYNFGLRQYRDCLAYGFGAPDKLERILLLGFETYDAATDEPHSTRSRQEMRRQVSSQVVVV